MEPEIWAVAAKAFNSLASKFPNLKLFLLNKLKIILESETMTSIEKAGAA